MTKTNIKLKIILYPLDGDTSKPDTYQEPHYTIKLDAQKFPYVVINNKKVIISCKEFPATYYGMFDKYEIDILEGKTEWDSIISNPELTVDKLSTSDIVYAARG